MIIVNLKPANLRTNTILPDHNTYYVSGIVNWHMMGRPTIWRPPTDVIETDQCIVVRVEIAGMRDGQVAVNFDQHILSINGTRSDNLEKRAFHQMEIHYGEFLTEVEVFVPIDTESITAEYQDGFLRVFLPKQTAKSINITQD